jgi:hypothetical protein
MRHRLFIASLLATAQIATAQVATQSNSAAIDKPLATSSVFFVHSTNGESAIRNQLLVFLRIENTGDSDIRWMSPHFEAEMYDATGTPVKRPASTASIPSALYPYRIPVGSAMDWLITFKGLSLSPARPDREHLEDFIEVILGSHGWYLPRDSLGTYSLKVRVFGTIGGSLGPKQLLFDPPRTNLTSR